MLPIYFNIAVRGVSGVCNRSVSMHERVKGVHSALRGLGLAYRGIIPTYDVGGYCIGFVFVALCTTLDDVP
jgi:hypothetical protein